MEWYYTAGSERRGPVDAATLEALAARGELTRETLVWNATMPDWAPYADVVESALPGTLKAVAEAESAEARPAVLQSKPLPLFRAFFLILLAEAVLGGVMRLSFMVGQPLNYLPGISFVMQAIFWLNLCLGAVALIVTGKQATPHLRLCVIVPFVWGVAYSLFFRVVIGTRIVIGNGIFDSGSDTATLFALLHLGSWMSFAITLGAAVYGLRLLKRMPA